MIQWTIHGYWFKSSATDMNKSGSVGSRAHAQNTPDSPFHLENPSGWAVPISTLGDETFQPYACGCETNPFCLFWMSHFEPSDISFSPPYRDPYPLWMIHSLKGAMCWQSVACLFEWSAKGSTNEQRLNGCKQGFAHLFWVLLVLYFSQLIAKSKIAHIQIFAQNRDLPAMWVIKRTVSFSIRRLGNSSRSSNRLPIVHREIYCWEYGYIPIAPNLPLPPFTSG